MTEFTVHVANRPGMLAHITELLADAGINIEALAAYGMGEMGQMRMMVDDAATTRGVLERAGLSFDEREVLCTMLSHQPGAMAIMARRLADAGVNIEAVYLLHASAEGLEFAVAVDDPARARERI